MCPGTRQNLPLGPEISSRSPTFRLSGNQLEIRPPSTRFTVISSTKGRVGDDEIE
jgi:hypothetical protein